MKTPTKHIISLAALLAMALTAPAASAQTAGAQADSAADRSLLERTVQWAEKVLDLLTVEGERWSVATYPAASYSGRTGLAVGIMQAWQHSGGRSHRPTTIAPTVLVSTKRMFEIQADADIYPSERISIGGKAEFFYLPDDYYGIGNGSKSVLTEYTIHKYSLTADVLADVARCLRVGLTADICYVDFSGYDAGLASAFESGWCNGLGPMVQFDTRDDVVYPTSGWLATAAATGFWHGLGSRSDFVLAELDVRRYIDLHRRRVVAMQALLHTSTADAPFWKLPSCGGTRLGRAIPHSLKYVDRNAWLLQAEYRCPVYWRIGATAFAAAGNVSHTWAARELTDRVHLMLGGGLRFNVLPGRNLNMRLDAGISSRGDHAFYLNIREAF